MPASWERHRVCHASGVLGRLHHVVLDCPDPAALAAFYSQLLGQPITYQGDDWVVVAANDTSSGLAFQLARDHRPPTWPDPAVPQQVHLDVMVEDVAAAEPWVLALGAKRLDGGNIYADPAGHPFCLIRRPGWAPPIPPTGMDTTHPPDHVTIPPPKRSSASVPADQLRRRPRRSAEGRSSAKGGSEYSAICASRLAPSGVAPVGDPLAALTARWRRQVGALLLGARLLGACR
jgi:catechol 2,3-dioxygenase-like lactoylglutathione lyase family enzyme